jgi:hypothetical protein
MVSPAFLAEMDRQQGTTPRTKVEFIDKAANVTDISAYYLSGANFEQVRQRAVAEIQAGQFDIVVSNQDDTFSEYKVGSLLYNLDYHGAQIRVSQGFLLPDGTLEFEPQCTLFIDQLTTDPLVSQVTFSCRDILGFIMDQKLHAHPIAEIPVPDSGNVGDGVLSDVAKLPFVSVNEDWTLTCTTPGTDAVAQFSVVGSISGSIGPATSGTEFISAAHGIRFTINAGATDWSIGDKFTFSMSQFPQWDTVNAGKIIWSILTGYNWDTNVQEPFSDLVFDFDNTQSDANTDIDYDAFATVIAVIDAIGVFAIKGYIPYDTDAVTLLQNTIVMFLGSIYSGNDGRIKMTTYVPAFTPNFRTFADTLKIIPFDYFRGIDEVINHVSVTYIASDVWPWSNSSVTLNGSYVDEDPTSVSDRGQYSQDFAIPWFSPSGDHVQDFTSKLITRYKDPPLEIEFTTGMDGLLTEMGDRVVINDEKSGFSGIIGEVTRIVKQFDQSPASIMFRVRKDGTTNTIFGVIGSSADEGDGLSPQSDNYDTASTSDKQFAYFSKVGSSADPQYFIF